VCSYGAVNDRNNAIFSIRVVNIIASRAEITNQLINKNNNKITMKTRYLEFKTPGNADFTKLTKLSK
jgi:hypothetical protein